MKKQLVKVILMAGIGAFVVPNTAKAALQITLTSGASVVPITDNGPGDTNPAVGYINVNGPLTVGDFRVDVLTGVSTRGGVATLLLQNADFKNTAALPSVLDILVSDNGYVGTGAGSSLTTSVSANALGAQAGDTVTFQSYHDITNLAPSLAGFTTGPQVAAFTPPPPGNAQSFTSNNFLSPFTSPSTFSLTEHVVVNVSAHTTIALTDLSSSPDATVPEPASLSLLGLGALALLRRRR